MSIFKQIAKAAFAVVMIVVPSRHRPYSFCGGKIYIDVTESPMMLARVLGRYEIEKHKALDAFLPAGGVFVDVGVNRGDFSLRAAKIVGDTGRVLAFEPAPDNCAWIRKSIELNGYTNIDLNEVALSDSNGSAVLFIGQKSGWHSLAKERKVDSRGQIEVRTLRLDNWLAEHAADDAIDVMKIDVEGAEMQVLRGAIGALQQNRAITLLIDIHPQVGVNPREVCDFLRERGFKVYREKSPFDAPVTDYDDLRSIVARR